MESVIDKFCVKKFQKHSKDDRLTLMGPGGKQSNPTLDHIMKKLSENIFTSLSRETLKGGEEILTLIRPN